MSTPEGPDEPWQGDPTAPPQEFYPDASYHQAPHDPPAPPPYQQPQYPPGPPPPPAQGPSQQQYPSEQQYPTQQPYQSGQYAPQAYPQQYEPVIYQQPPGPDQLPPPAAPPYAGSPYGGYPQTAPPNGSSRRTPLIITAVVVVVLALAAVGIVLLNRDDDNGKKGAQSPPPTTNASAPTAPPSKTQSSATSGSTTSPAASPSPTSVQQITVPSVISGWHGVLSYKENVAYDVPPDWKIETPDTLVGFEDANGQPVAIMHGVSTYKDKACPNVSGSYRGHTGFKTAGNLDPTTAARTGVKIFADGAAIKDDGSSAPVSGTTLKDITVDQGKIRAKYARATVTLNDKADCGSPTVVVVAVAFRSGPDATALFIGYFDQGVSDALPLTTVEKIFTSLRPYRR